jgi:pyruvate formate-lyase activating enzyme-like uncharacterized protein
MHVTNQASTGLSTNAEDGSRSFYLRFLASRVSEASVVTHCCSSTRKRIYQDRRRHRIHGAGISKAQ